MVTRSGVPIFQRPVGNARGAGSFDGSPFGMPARTHATSASRSASLRPRRLTNAPCRALAYHGGIRRSATTSAIISPWTAASR